MAVTPTHDAGFRRLGRSVRVLVVLGAAGVVGGCWETPELAAEDGFFYWVDPARCLDPCSGIPGDRLVRVGVDARPNTSGEQRVDRAVQPRLVELFDAAAREGYTITIKSSYRSYFEQLAFWNDSTEEIGLAGRPGQSEHQIGTAVDLDSGTFEGKQWLADHAFEHGFALSFPRGAEKLTGIQYEPWHFRYMGEPAALEIHANGWSSVEYLRAHPELGRFGDCGACPDSVSRSASCGDLDSAGLCDGGVLRFCVDGAAGVVDCTPSGSSCTVDALGDAECR